MILTLTALLALPVAHPMDTKVCVTDAVLGAKSGSIAWDPKPFGKSETIDVVKIAEAAAASPEGGIATAVTETLGALAGHALAPDIYGRISLNSGAKLILPQSFPNQYATSWSDACLLADLDKATKLTVELWDSDSGDMLFGNHDDTAGSVTLSNRELKAAFQARTDYAVRVNERGTGEILFVTVVVSKAT